jgi:sensor histidine kinase YesM
MFKQSFDNGRHFYLFELGFLLFICFGVSIISDLEFSYYEKHDISAFTEPLRYRLVTGFFSLILTGTFYWWILKPVIYSRRMLLILPAFIFYIIFSVFYDKYLINFVVSKLDFLPADLTERAVKDLNDHNLRFTINYLIIAQILPLLGLAFFTRSLYQDRVMDALKKQQMIAELTYLKAQLHPHFFFNTINNIYGLALKSSKDTAPMIAKLGDMMRYILYEASEPEVSISREVSFIKNYMAVEKIRHQESHQIELDVQVENEQLKINPLLLLPYVENAFKHGLEQETGNGFVKIIIHVDQAELTMEVHNSKPVLCATNKKKGIGLDNLKKRLDILYQGKHSVSVENTLQFYKSQLTLKL